MASVSMRTAVEASADAVWAVVSDFNGLPKFVAAIVESRMEGSGVGARRTLTLADGAVIVEQLESHDDAARTLSYSIVSSPLPLANYLSTQTVRPAGEGRCELEWASTFEPEGAPEAEAKAIVEGVYSAGFEGIQKLFGG